MTTETKTDPSALNPINFQKNELVTATQNGKPVTTSLVIAEKFEKRHDNIIRDIENMECPYEFGLLNFEETSYTDQWNRKQKMYFITRDGFTILAMGFTGKKAMEWKIKYITAFNAMEKKLSGGQVSISKRDMGLLQISLERIEEKLGLNWSRHKTNKTNPLAGFVDEACTIAPCNAVKKDELYRFYTIWSETKKYFTLHRNVFFKHLYTCAVYTKSARRLISGKSTPVVTGIAINTRADTAGEEK